MFKKIAGILFLSLGLNSFGQLQNNTLSARANFNFQQLFPVSSGMTMIQLNPSIGFVYKNRFESGLLFNFTYSKYNQSQTQTQTIFGGGVYTKMYFPLNDKMYFNIHGSFVTGVEKTYNSVNSNRFSSIAFSPRFSYFPIKNLSIEFGFGQFGVGFSQNSTNIILSSSTLTTGIAYFFSPTCKKKDQN